MRNLNKKTRKNFSGEGLPLDLILKLLSEIAPKVLGAPAEAIGSYLGSKIKKLTGGAAAVHIEQQKKNLKRISPLSA